MILPITLTAIGKFVHNKRMKQRIVITVSFIFLILATVERFELSAYGLEDRYSSAELYRHNSMDIGLEPTTSAMGGSLAICANP